MSVGVCEYVALLLLALTALLGHFVWYFSIFVFYRALFDMYIHPVMQFTLFMCVLVSFITVFWNTTCFFFVIGFTADRRGAGKLLSLQFAPHVVAHVFFYPECILDLCLVSILSLT